MTEDELRRAFESATLDGEQFDHRQHLRLAWIYLRDLPLAAAIETYADGLRRLTKSLGVSQKYHETITWAFLLLTHERMQRPNAPADWESFAAANPDLLNRENRILHRFYTRETLDSDFARRVFVFPDRLERSPK